MRFRRNFVFASALVEMFSTCAVIACADDDNKVIAQRTIFRYLKKEYDTLYRFGDIVKKLRFDVLPEFLCVSVGTVIGRGLYYILNFLYRKLNGTMYAQGGEENETDVDKKPRRGEEDQTDVDKEQRKSCKSLDKNNFSEQQKMDEERKSYNKNEISYTYIAVCVIIALIYEGGPLLSVYCAWVDFKKKKIRKEKNKERKNVPCIVKGNKECVSFGKKFTEDDIDLIQPKPFVTKPRPEYIASLKKKYRDKGWYRESEDVEALSEESSEDENF